jgi:hypothetical protein
VRTKQASKTTNPKVLEVIEKYLLEMGMYNITVAKVHSYLQERLPKEEVPCRTSVKHILKSTFHFKYAALNKANTKYKDSTYNEKRLWISRLLTQFMIEDAMIISVDDSNFRSDAFPSKSWQFRVPTESTKKIKPTVAARRSLNAVFAKD